MLARWDVTGSHRRTEGVRHVLLIRGARIAIGFGRLRRRRVEATDVLELWPNRPCIAVKSLAWLACRAAVAVLALGVRTQIVAYGGRLACSS